MKQISINKPRKVAFYTLGCKLNYAETSMISRKFVENGYEHVGTKSDADIIVINTCSVTQVAEKKCRQAIKKANDKGAKVVVVGCYSQLRPNEIAEIQGVDLVLGTKEKFHILEYVEGLYNGQTINIFSENSGEIDEYESAFSLNGRTRAFLKIQDGCDYYCSYCTVPLARGKSRNESVEKIIGHAKKIASSGIKEIVLTGVNIGDFGKTTNETFYQLICQLEKIQQIERFRISSIEPNLVSDEIITFIAGSEKFVPHFHIPLQSGCNRILSMMNRRYNRELYLDRVNKIKSLMPFACIGSDIIAGFPGESEEDFFDSYKFIESLNIDYLHVFPYSERPNTRAVSIVAKVKSFEKTNRCRMYSKLSDVKRAKFLKLNFGRQEKVIFESKCIDGKMFGFTSNYIKVETSFKSELIGKVVDVNLNTLNLKGFEV